MIGEDEKVYRVQEIQRKWRKLKWRFFLWLIVQLGSYPTARTTSQGLSFLMLLYFNVVVIHATVVYLHDLRWNPNRLQNTQKKKEQQVVIAGDFSLNPNANYRVGDDGELESVE